MESNTFDIDLIKGGSDILFYGENSILIEKFEGSQFHTWQIRSQSILIEKDLWDVVSVQIFDCILKNRDESPM